MTSNNNDIRRIFSGGIRCLSDAGLYTDNYLTCIKVLSIYGAPQQIRAIFAILVQWGVVKVENDERGLELRAAYREKLRVKMTTLGYEKKRALIYVEDIDKGGIIWTSPEEKEAAILAAIAKRKIPFNREWLPDIEKLFLLNQIFLPLKGWGGLRGYWWSNWANDDQICDLICEYLKISGGNRNGA